MSGYILCASVADTSIEHTVPNSEKRWCAICAEELWISPSGIATVEAEDVQPICGECFVGLPEGPIHPAPGTREELLQLGLTDAQIRTLAELEQAYLTAKRKERNP